MKPKKKNAEGRPGQNANDKYKNGTTEETTLREKLELQNTALEKIKTAVMASKGITLD